MNSIKDILNMVYTEAIGGGIGDHYFDEFRNREFIERDNRLNNPEPEMHMQQSQQLPPIKYKLELIRDKHGKLVWDE